LAAKFAGLELPEGTALSINLVGPRVMRRINREFLGHDNLTDVICFDYRDDSSSLTDGAVAVEILISPDMAEIQASELPTKRTPGSELLLYLVHGVLHAAGELDATPAQRRRMRRREREVLNSLAESGVTSL
jgi:probable rRNA maturation factor